MSASSAARIAMMKAKAGTLPLPRASPLPSASQPSGSRRQSTPGLMSPLIDDDGLSVLQSPGLGGVHKKLSFGSVAESTPGTGGTQASKEEVDASQLRVFLRVRPLTGKEQKAGQTCAVEVTNPTQVDVTVPSNAKATKRAGSGPDSHQSFTFDRVFDEDTSQAELFSSVMRRSVDGAIKKGESGLVFSYGQTNAGKTYTVTGSDRQPGMLPRALHHLFSVIDKANRKQAARAADEVAKEDAEGGPAGSSPGREEGEAHTPAQRPTGAGFIVAVSYLEIYNERLHDLLADVQPGAADASAAARRSSRAAAAAAGGPQPAPPQLRIKEGRDGRVHVRGLKTVTVSCLQRALEVMKQGAANKQVAQTAMNADSSRSHTVFTISVYRAASRDLVQRSIKAKLGGTQRMGQRNAPPPLTPSSKGHLQLWSRLSIVDLAGSERQSRTGSRGARLKEAGRINNSLMTLMQCMSALRHNGGAGKDRVVPYRDSKLTRIFSDYFSGPHAGHVSMVVNIGPAAADVDETLHALRYAAVAREVKVEARVSSRWAGASKYDMNGRRKGAHNPAPRPARTRASHAAAGAGAAAAAAAGPAGGIMGGARRRRQASTSAAAAPSPVAAKAPIAPAETPAAWREERGGFEARIAELQAELEAAREDAATWETRAVDVELTLREQMAKELEDRVEQVRTFYAQQQEADAEQGQRRERQRLRLQTAVTTGKRIAFASRLPKRTEEDKEDEEDDEAGRAEAEAGLASALEAAERRVSVGEVAAVGDGDDEECLQDAAADDDDDSDEDEDDEDDDEDYVDSEDEAEAPIRLSCTPSRSDDSAEDALANGMVVLDIPEVAALRAQLEEAEAELDREKQRRAEAESQWEERCEQAEFAAQEAQAAKEEAADQARAAVAAQEAAEQAAMVSEAAHAHLLKQNASLEEQVAALEAEKVALAEQLEHAQAVGALKSPSRPQARSRARPRVELVNAGPEAEDSTEEEEEDNDDEAQHTGEEEEEEEEEEVKENLRQPKRAARASRRSTRRSTRSRDEQAEEEPADDGDDSPRRIRQTRSRRSKTALRESHDNEEATGKGVAAGRGRRPRRKAAPANLYDW